MGIKKEDFKKDNIDTYQIVTLGGNHLRVATQELLKDNQNMQIKNVEVDLYADLTTEEGRRVANVHNLQLILNLVF